MPGIFDSIIILSLILVLFGFVRTKETLVSSISGKVIKGDGTSRNYGYRTANMKIKKPMECGVFNGTSQYGKTTILSNGTNYVECHIHDFKKNIYGETLEIKNIDYIDKGEPKKDCLWAKGWI
tara:strand:+ start:155 stop:523 length:369 start_codon:yes stop_codon:yes gene_type:complete